MKTLCDEIASTISALLFLVPAFIVLALVVGHGRPITLGQAPEAE